MLIPSNFMKRKCYIPEKCMGSSGIRLRVNSLCNSRYRTYSPVPYNGRYYKGKRFYNCRVRPSVSGLPFNKKLSILEQCINE